jgi:formylglycine-generating enzyme required for sulfatase activity
MNPVETVSWKDAAEFCKKLAKKTRQAVRLPTEAEWEYACRAGRQASFPFGGVPSALGEYAWHAGNGKTNGNVWTTHPVGQRKPNAWGLYDMHGNLWEWCADWFAVQYPKGPATDPSGPASGDARVMRGESWSPDDTGVFRCAHRRSNVPTASGPGCGFRCAMTPP